MSDRRPAAEEAARRDLRADIEQGGERAVAWLWPSYDDPDRAKSGAQYGFHPGFTALVSALAGNPKRDPGKTFVMDLLHALPASAQTGRIARRWLLTALEIDVAPQLMDTPAAAGAAAAIDLMRASIDGPVESGRWRSVRSALARVAGLDGNASRYAEVVASAMWDLDAAPGAVSDTVGAIGEAIAVRVHRAMGWTREMARELGSIEGGIMEQAVAAVGTDGEPEALRKAFLDERARLIAAAPRASELGARRDACFAQGNDVRLAWSAAGHERLISLATNGKDGIRA